MNRRRFLVHSAALSLAGIAARASPFAGEANTCVVQLESSHAKGDIPENFTGLSYEAAQLADPNFFSPANTALIGLVHRLGRRGVLRIGGNTSDFTVWHGAARGPVAPTVRPRATAPYIPISKASIRALAGFLDATGWSLIYGLNLGTGTPAQAAAEAKAVAGLVGMHRVVFQIGNEPDIFGSRLRPHMTWNFNAYIAQWRLFANSVCAAVPEAAFAGPDTAEVDSVDWIVPFARALGQDVRFLSEHYYAEGPPESAQTTITKLLSPNPRLQKMLSFAAQARQIARRPVRMTETNSCYWGGKPGVSDRFASALWGGDFMLRLADAGYCGVNFHGGASKSLSAALGGGPLANVWSEQDRIDRVSGSYTPIAGNEEVGFRPRPLYYGMLLAEQLCGGNLIRADMQIQKQRDVSVYAVRLHSELRAAVFNKESTMPFRVTVHPGRRAHHARMWSLTAPSLHCREDVLLAGAAVSGTGMWIPQEEFVPISAEGSIQVELPAASAALLFFDI